MIIGRAGRGHRELPGAAQSARPTQWAKRRDTRERPQPLTSTHTCRANFRDDPLDDRTLRSHAATETSHADQRLELLDRLLAGRIVLVVQRLRARERGLIIRSAFFSARAIDDGVGCRPNWAPTVWRAVGPNGELGAFRAFSIFAISALQGPAWAQPTPSARSALVISDQTGELRTSCTIVCRHRMPPASASCPRHNRSQHAPPPGAHLTCAAPGAATFWVGS